MRFVNHRIFSLPRTPPVVSAKCRYEDCTWEATESADVADVDRQCMSHTSLNPYHSMFSRSYEDIAIVQRVSE